MAIIKITGYQCNRCGYRWAPRKVGQKRPLVCSKCKSPYWNIPRKEK